MWNELEGFLKKTAKGTEEGRKRNVWLSRFLFGVAAGTLGMGRKSYSLEKMRGRSPEGVKLGAPQGLTGSRASGLSPSLNYCHRL